MSFIDIANQIIQPCEGCVLRPYHGKADRPGVWSIGFGFTEIDGVKVGPNTAPISQQRALEILDQKLASFDAELMRDVRVPLTDHQHGALLSFVYNIGDGNFEKSDVLQHLNAGDYAGAAACLPHWNRANGVVCAGLVDRRALERHVFETADVPEFHPAMIANANLGAPATNAPMSDADRLMQAEIDSWARPA